MLQPLRAEGFGPGEIRQHAARSGASGPGSQGRCEAAPRIAEARPAGKHVASSRIVLESARALCCCMLTDCLSYGIGVTFLFLEGHADPNGTPVQHQSSCVSKSCPAPCRYQAQHRSSRRFLPGYGTLLWWQMRLYQTVHWCLPVMGAAHASGDLRQCLTIVSLHGSPHSCMCAAMAHCHICMAQSPGIQRYSVTISCLGVVQVFADDWILSRGSSGAQLVSVRFKPHTHHFLFSLGRIKAGAALTSQCNTAEALA